MKKGLAVIVGSMLLSTYALAHCCCCQCGQMMKQKSCGNSEMMMKKHKYMKDGQGMKKEQKKMMQKVQPKNIDKNNVGITANEEADQTDPTLIEGNLENNDFKN